MTHPVEHAAAATVASIEAAPMSIGLAIGAILAVGAIVSVVWTVATIRSNDRTDINKDIADGDRASQNATDRLEKKTDGNHDILHGRVNKQMEKDEALAEKMGYIRGTQDTQMKILLKLMDKL